MEKVTGLDRKSLIRLLKSPLERKPRTKQRGRTYGADVDAAIGVVSATLHYPCAERFTPNLAWMAAHLATHQELGVSDALLEQLERISISTEGRRLRTMRPHQARRPRKPPRAPTLQRVPMERTPWITQDPAHLEAATVRPRVPSRRCRYRPRRTDRRSGGRRRWRAPVRVRRDSEAGDEWGAFGGPGRTRTLGCAPGT
jgi:hypothetical protein